MDAHKLKMWRKRHKLTQAQAAARLGLSEKTWTRYEAGASPITQDVIDHCAAHPNREAGAEPPPTDTAELTRKAVSLAGDYIEGMKGLPAKFGKATPWRWAASYWYEGAIRAQYVYWGYSGHTPCVDALRAGLATLDTFEQAGGVWQSLAQLDDCPANIKARAEAIP